MRPLLCALAGLALLRAPGAFAADEPFIPSRGDSAQSTECDRYMAVHSRLDVIEEIAFEHQSWSRPAAGSDTIALLEQNRILAWLPQ
uniref:Placenta associated 9 n=1 Tax=Moschus moschiferus TaxID=68415 RepID=A0A8C6MMC4_MOSMO